MIGKVVYYNGFMDGWAGRHRCVVVAERNKHFVLLQEGDALLWVKKSSLKKPVLIGLAPADPKDITSKGETAFSGPTGKFLAKIAGLPDLSAFDCKNLLPYAETAYGVADKHNAASQRVKVLTKKYSGGIIILCGSFVAKAFGFNEKQDWLLGNGPFMDADKGTAFYVIPHPSGRCRLWNDYAVRTKIGALLRSLATC
jgi:uracil-DNA glycosylase